MQYGLNTVYPTVSNPNFRFDGTNFVTAASSNHPHKYTSLGKMNEGLIAISGESHEGSSVEVELFSNGNWNAQPPFLENVCV